MTLNDEGEADYRDIAYKALREVEEESEKPEETPAEEEPEQPKEEEEPEEEETPEGGSEEEETEEEGEEEEPFDLPDDFEFEITEDGKPKKVKGEALKNAWRQRQNLERQFAELKAKREQWDKEQAELRKKIEFEVAKETYDQLLRARALIETPDGKVIWNPALSASEREAAQETAQAGAEAKVSEEAGITVPRINLEDLGEEAAFVPPKLVEVTNQLAELLEKERKENLELRQSWQAEQQRRAQAEEEARIAKFRQEVEAAVSKSDYFGSDPKLKEIGTGLVVNAIANGFEGSLEDCVSTFEQTFLKAPATKKEEVSGEPAATPEKKAGGSASPRKKAPPAVGSPGRHPAARSENREKDEAPLGSDELAAQIEEDLKRYGRA